eukprot:m.76393 g.76393  ORF g.76393 m.76393 type:complete len:602 (-) comp14634_c0_seq2:611-2416(-)
MSTPEDAVRSGLLGAMEETWSSGGLPLVVLPGIMGSELKIGDTAVWLSRNTLTGLDQLRFGQLKPDEPGVNLNGATITATREVRSIIRGNDDSYEKIRSVKGAVLYPYDWRQSLAVEAKKLRAFLKDARGRFNLLKSQNRTSLPEAKLHIVTHSMGSLLLMTALGQSDELDELLSSVTFTAPPFRGAVDILSIIETGKQATMNSTVDALIARATPIVRCARSFPGTIQLLLHDEAAFSPLNNVLGNWAYPIPGLTDPLAAPFIFDWVDGDAVLRVEVMEQARKFRKDFQRWIDDVPVRLDGKTVPVRVIVGLDTPTLNYAELRTDGRWFFDTKRSTAKDKTTFPGDGRVLFQSSYLPKVPMEKHYCFPRPKKMTDSLHGVILMQDEVVQAIRDIIAGNEPAGLQALNPVTISKFAAPPQPKAADAYKLVHSVAAAAVVAANNYVQNFETALTPEEREARQKLIKAATDAAAAAHSRASALPLPTAPLLPESTRRRPRVEEEGITSVVEGHVRRAEMRRVTPPGHWGDELNPIVPEVPELKPGDNRDEAVLLRTKEACNELLTLLTAQPELDLTTATNELAPKYNVPAEFISNQVDSMFKLF